MKILIVDDNRENLYLLETLLKGSGYEVVSAINGTEALEKLRSEATNMIISDILMSVMDGFQLCREVKRDDELKDIPFVFYTATYTDEKDEELALKMGADKFIRKPVEPDEFIKIIQAVMKDVERGKLKPKKLAFEEEKEILKLYNERLVKKLEKKMLDLEREITERKRAEERYRELFETSLDGIAVTDIEGCYLDCNQAYLDLLGYDGVDELRSRSYKEVTPPEYHELEDRIIKEQTLVRGYCDEYEKEYIRKTGERIPVTLRAWLRRDPANQPGGMWVIVRDITERKRMEEALQESEEKYRSLFETANEGIFLADETGRFVDVNREACKSLGYSKEELLRLSIREIDSDPRGHEPFFKVRDGLLKRVIFEANQRRKDGTLLSVEIAGSSFTSRGKRIFLGIARNIIERKQAEERLRLLSSAIEQSSDGIAVTDLEGNLLFVNNAFATMHGYAAEELVGRHLSLFHTTEQMPSVEAANQQVQNTGEFSGEIWHVRRGGMVFPTLMHNSLLLDETGNAIGMIGSLIDITEHKRAEKALRESEERYRELFETSLDGIAVTDIEGCYLDCNQAYLDLLGYDGVDELRSRSYKEVTPPEYHELEDRIIKEQTLVRGYCDEYEKEYIRKTGERIPVTLRAWLRRDPANQPGGRWVIIRDITERKQVDEVLRESEERLRYLSSQLISAQEEERKRISLELHDEMGQALTAIGLNLESIGKELPPEHAAIIKNKLAETISLVEHASDHVRDLSLDLRPSMLDDLGLVPTLRWYVNSYEKRTETPVIFEALNLGERLTPEVKIVLYRVVQESLNNIRKHAQAKKVKIRLEQKKKKIGVLIEDDGIGFYPDRVVSKTTPVKGIGLLGMQERVRLLGGSLKIRSREGQGASIFVELPLH
jgi:PAS domain S-box-containing protein